MNIESNNKEKNLGESKISTINMFEMLQSTGEVVEDLKHDSSQDDLLLHSSHLVSEDLLRDKGSLSEGSGAKEKKKNSEEGATFSQFAGESSWGNS